MTSLGASERHLTVEGLEHYISGGAPAVIKIEGAPIIYLVIDPSIERLSLRTPLTRHALPDVSAYQHFSSSAIHWNDEPWFELRVDGEVLRDAYPVICSIADRIQLEGTPFDSAVSGSLAAFREVLAQHDRLSLEEELGLFGELVLLRHLLSAQPPADAVAGWRGPDAEEHDFDIQGNDVELKCTLAEERIHWINGMGQLEPTQARPLWLLSMQLTRAGNDGVSLAELIQEINSLVSAGDAAQLFNSKLSSAGWRGDSAHQHKSKFRLRSSPAVYAVNDRFPALIRSRLAAAGFDLAHIVQLRYALNLKGLLPEAAPPEFLKNMGSFP